MDTIFMNSKNIKRCDPHRLLLNLLDKTEFIKMLLYQIVAFTIHGKI